MKISTRLSVLLLTLSLSASLSGLAQTRTVQETVNLSSGGSLSLDIFKGTVRLTSWDKEQVEIHARIEAGPDTTRAYAKVSVDSTEIDIHSSGNSVSIRSDYSDVPCKENLERIWRGNNCSKTLPFIHYEVRAPRSARLTLESHRAEITITGFNNGLRLDAHRGKIHLSDLEGDLQLDTHRGEIDAENLSGRLRLNTHRGTMRLAGFRGRFEVDTHRGKIEVDDAQLDGRSSINTYRGNIRLTLPASQKLSVEAEIDRRGDFHTDFEMTVRRFGRERFEGEINGGGPRLTIKNYRGDVRLERQ